MVPDLRLLAIAGPAAVELGNLREACLEAEAGGVTGVQLRFKSQDAASVLAQARELVQCLSIPLWINDRADIAVAAGAFGVHVGWEDIPVEAIRAFAGKRLRIGLSVGDEAEARRALPASADYWSIGPIFATRTKADAGQPIGPDGYRELATLAPASMPTIAIGGIAADNVEAVLAAGAHGVAVSEAVFGAADIREAAAGLRAVIDRFLPQ
jgi:thiamine-phosphate pyrophosphorylase